MMFDGREIVRTRNLLYRDEVGRDACGIGGIAAREGKPSHEVVKKALLALRNVEHRGGVCGNNGDGAGITCQLPQEFFKEEARRLRFDQARSLRPEDRVAVGVFFFLDTQELKRDEPKAIAQEVLSQGPAHLSGSRAVPTNPHLLPHYSPAAQPA